MRRRLLVCLASMMCAGSALAAAPASAPASAPAGASEAGLPDGRIFLAAPPRAGSLGQAEDDRAFAVTRSLKDTPRWDLARNDVKLDPAHMLADFSCSAGRELNPGDLPRLVDLLKHYQAALVARTSEEKDHWRRIRPFVGNDQPMCEDDRDQLGHSFSYPSGHTTAGWMMAELLAELFPQQATEILHRGHVFGESRIVCGAHWKSDVQAGFINAGAYFAALQGDPEFQTRMNAIREDIAHEHFETPDPARCAAERKAEVTPVVE